MKKTVISALSLILALLMFASCGKTAPAEVSIQEIYGKITSSVTMPEQTLELAAGDLKDFYNIDAEKVSEFAAVQDACGYKDEIVIIKAADEAAAQEIAELLTNHIEYQKNSMKNYAPEQYKILGSSSVITKGVYTAMFISAEQDAMAEIFNSYFG